MNLGDIQNKMKVEKSNKNTFGNYRYRTCSDIIEEFKSLNTGMILLMHDEIVECGGRVFVKATVSLHDDEGFVANSVAFAETGPMGGMSTPQTTGAASTYARKYALCGLFAIDDSADDPDDERNQPKPKKASAPKPSTAPAKKPISDENIRGLMGYMVDHNKNFAWADANYALTETQKETIKQEIS